MSGLLALAWMALFSLGGSRGGSTVNPSTPRPQKEEQP